MSRIDEVLREIGEKAKAMMAGGGERCDFCCNGTAVVDYPCESFEAIMTFRDPLTGEHGRVVRNLIGGWGACDACAVLIDSNRWDDLLNRYFRTIEEKDPGWSIGFNEDVLADFTGDMDRLYAGFRKYRIKNPTLKNPARP